MDNLAEGLGQVDLNALRLRNSSSGNSNNNNNDNTTANDGMSSDVSDLLSGLGSSGAAGPIAQGNLSGAGMAGQISLSDLRSARAQQMQQQQQQQQPSPLSPVGGRFPSSPAGGGLSALLAGMSPKRTDPVAFSSSQPGIAPVRLTGLGVPAPPASFAPATVASSPSTHFSTPSDQWTVTNNPVAPHELRIPRAVRARPVQSPYPVCKRPLNLPYDPVTDMVAISDSFVCYVKRAGGDSVRILGRAVGSQALAGPFEVPVSHVASYHSHGAATDNAPDVLMVGLADGWAIMYSIGEDVSTKTVQIKEIGRVRTGTGAAVRTVAWSPETLKVFSLGDGASLMCFDTSPIATLPVSGNIGSATYLSPSLLAHGTGASVNIWDSSTRATVASWVPFSLATPVEVVRALFPNLLLTTSSNNAQWRVWRIENQTITLTSHIIWQSERASTMPLLGRISVVPSRTNDTDSVICFTEADAGSLGAGSFSAVRIARDTGDIRRSNSGEYVVEFSGLRSSPQEITMSLASSRVRNDSETTAFGDFDVCHVTNEALSLHPLSIEDIYIDHDTLRQSQEYLSSSQRDRGNVAESGEGFFTPGVSAAAAAAHSGSLVAEHASSSGSESEDESDSGESAETKPPASVSSAPSVPPVREQTLATVPVDARQDASAERSVSAVSDFNKANTAAQHTKKVVDFDTSDDVSTDEDLALKGSVVLAADEDDGTNVRSEHVARSGGLSKSDVSEIVSLALQQHTEQSDTQHRQLLATIAHTLNSSVKFHVEKQIQSQMTALTRSLAKSLEQTLVPSLKAEISAVLKQRHDTQAGTRDSAHLQGIITDAFAGAFQSTLIPAFDHASREMLSQLSSAVGSVARNGADGATADSKPSAPAQRTLEELLDLCSADQYLEAFSDALFRGDPQFVMQLCVACENRSDIGGIADAVSALGEQQRLLLTLIAQIGTYKPFTETVEVLEARLTCLFEAIVVHLDPSDESISGVVGGIMGKISTLLEEAKVNLTVSSQTSRQLNALVKKTKQLSS